MSKGGGFIKIHRSMLDWEWYGDDRCVRLLLHLHLKANYQPGRWKGNDVCPGQLVTSTVALAEQLGWSRSALVRTLDRLKLAQEVDTKSDSKWTLVTLTKWDKFQVEGAKPDSKTDTKRTRTGQQTGQQADTIEEGEERKKEKNTPSGVARGASIEDRKAAFVEKCKAVVDAQPDRLPKKLRSGFLSYWTEASETGKMRFEDEKYFDHGRRMDTWRNGAIKRGEITTVEAGEPVRWNPRA